MAAPKKTHKKTPPKKVVSATTKARSAATGKAALAAAGHAKAASGRATAVGTKTTASRPLESAITTSASLLFALFIALTILMLQLYDRR